MTPGSRTREGRLPTGLGGNEPGSYCGSVGNTSRVAPCLRPPLAIAALFGLSRVAFYVAGVRMDTTAISGKQGSTDWQQLDLDQLHHNFVQSIWYLHSQPPLFNMASGVLVKLPAQLVTPIVVLVGLALGLGIALCCFYLCLELHLPRGVASLVTVLVVLDPASVLYQNWFFYTYPTAFAVTFAALCGARYLRGRHRAWGAGFFGSLATVVLLNSTFQWPWLVLAAVPLVVVLRRRWRDVLVVALVPVLCVTFWYAKDAVLFQTYTTSSWVGMNLARITTKQATPQQLDTLIKRGTVTPLSRIKPFTVPLAAYGQRLSKHPRTGVAVLDQVVKSDGTVNYNNVNFVAISDQYLHNDVGFIEAYPDTYARSVGKAVMVFMLPSEQYLWVAPNESQLSGYVRAYDLLVDGQPAGVNPSTWTKNAEDGLAPSFWHIAWFTVLEYLITMLVAPFLAWRRRSNLPYALTLGFMSLTTVYLFAVSNFMELGDNNRFRADLGPLPLIATAAVVTVAVVRIRRGGAPGEPVSAGPPVPERPLAVAAAPAVSVDAP